MGRPVAFAEDCIGPAAEKAAKALKPGEVLLLENTRFHPEEEKNDLDMAKQMASLADMYVNDAFGTAHRAHASTEGVARFLPAAAGFLLEKEIRYLGQAVADPKRPFVAFWGGQKSAIRSASFATC
jgi:phosphoglycerate kinase